MARHVDVTAPAEPEAITIMRHLFAAAAILVSTAGPLLAAEEAPARVRGTIESVSASTRTSSGRLECTQPSTSLCRRM